MYFKQMLAYQKCVVRVLGVCLALTFCVFKPAMAIQDRYTIDDLFALERSGSWSELWAHLLDIKPSRRDEEWERLGITVTQAKLDTPYPMDQPEQSFLFVLEALDRLPFLKDNAAFMASRTDIGLQRLHTCFQAGSPRTCRNNFLAFIAQAPKDHALAFAAGKIVRRKMSYTHAMAFFHHALQVSITPNRCLDEDVWLALNASLELRDTQAESVRMAQDIAFGVCWDSLKKKLVDGVLGTPKRMQHTCQGLLDKQALTGVRLKKCKTALSALSSAS